MAIDLSTTVTSVWPITESKLSADATVDYATQKAAAIAKAKRELYRSGTVPAEADIPEVAAYWIADQAVVFLVPLAKDYYMTHTRISDSKENTNITYHNVLAALDSLRDELQAGLVENHQAAMDAIGAAEGEDAVPAVSSAGMAVDPMRRAMARGPW